MIPTEGRWEKSCSFGWFCFQGAELVVDCGRVSPHSRFSPAGLDFRHEPQHSHPHRRQAMSLISLVVTLIVIGVLLWLVNTYIPMDGKIKKILNIVVVICVVVWLLYAFGILDRSSEIRVPRVQ
jgi:hypothetical protein